MKDDLSKLLGSWQPEVPERADFTRNVWRRIELANPLGVHRFTGMKPCLFC
jgi:hypothetical protein